MQEVPKCIILISPHRKGTRNRKTFIMSLKPTSLPMLAHSCQSKKLIKATTRLLAQLSPNQLNTWNIKIQTPQISH
ncbi:hypothetical protein FGO68_gene13624 [Halteria grandinella]|uniref:Uncharacterized protein n=1 Tax=Halteria grandinella TaxID=5974 RepID=A0A8J8TAB2_HALGN|nr:hypothetical protein FGO68_gene13624 [Halteria grandinella]